jgi:putative ABC transport system substrate-binding protein
MKRRKFIVTGSAAVWSFAARAQLVEPERSSRPVIGFLNNMSSESWRSAMPGLRQGLSEVGFVEGRNVAFAYRWTEGKRAVIDNRHYRERLLLRRCQIGTRVQ